MMVENLDAFLNTDEFAHNGTVGTATVTGILDRDFAEVNGVEGYYPQFLVKTSDAALVSIGAVITINALSYKVMAKRPDGTGFSTMILEAAA